MSEAKYLVGDVFDRMAELPDGSVDVVVTSPPFLNLRSYLPSDHPDKGREIGAEASPAEFIDTLLHLTAEWDRLLAPHGSLCVELGDTRSGSGGAGGDYNQGGLRYGQHRFRQVQTREHRPERNGTKGDGGSRVVPVNGGDGWPMAKSMCGIPHLYHLSLAYGMNLLTGEPSPAGRWRIRNVLCWARPNPPVGALGDKFRDATSYVTVACKSSDRWFDLDAVRTPLKHPDAAVNARPATLNRGAPGQHTDPSDAADGMTSNPAGAPPLDWFDEQAEDMWQPFIGMPTQPYPGAHHAVYPPKLPKTLIEAMCPREVCTQCGLPRRRIVDVEGLSGSDFYGVDNDRDIGMQGKKAPIPHITRTTVGWTDCGCGAPFRNGVVLDPFGGSGTTGAVATGLGRDAILIDIDAKNMELARDRIGMFLTEE